MIPAPKSKLAPPPKKSELIEALALREQEKRTIALAERTKDLKQFEAEFQEAAIKALKADIAAGAIGKYDTHYRYTQNNNHVDTVRLTFSLDQNIPVLRDLSRKIEALKKQPQRVPELHEIRRQVRDKLNGHTMDPGKRVKAMLADAETLASLDKMLAVLNGPAQLQIT